MPEITCDPSAHPDGLISQCRVFVWPGTVGTGLLSPSALVGMVSDDGRSILPARCPWAQGPTPDRPLPFLLEDGTPPDAAIFEATGILAMACVIFHPASVQAGNACVAPEFVRAACGETAIARKRGSLTIALEKAAGPATFTLRDDGTCQLTAYRFDERTFAGLRMASLGRGVEEFPGKADGHEEAFGAPDDRQAETIVRRIAARWLEEHHPRLILWKDKPDLATDATRFACRIADLAIAFYDIDAPLDVHARLNRPGDDMSRLDIMIGPHHCGDRMDVARFAHAINEEAGEFAVGMELARDEMPALASSWAVVRHQIRFYVRKPSGHERLAAMNRLAEAFPHLA